jgi:hypothetical protein
MQWPWLKALAPYLMGVALLAVAFMAGRWIDGEAREKKVALKLVEGVARVQYVAMQEDIADKAQLWQLVAGERAETAALLERFDHILGASDVERAAFRNDLAASRATQQRLRDEAAAIMKELDNERSREAEDWKRGRFPGALNCRVLGNPHCPKLSDDPATGAGGGAGRIPGEAAGAGGAGDGSGVQPVGADRRPGDG